MKNCYQIVTDRIIAQLKQGIIPWEKPWHGRYNGAYNRITQKPYSLINQMLLEHEGEYATFQQWVSAGGKIRKGEKSEVIVFWKLVQVEEEIEEQKRSKIIPVLKFYKVFHISQVENVKPRKRPDRKISIPKADDMIQDYITREGIILKDILSDRAYYSPTRDMIVIPKKEQYSFGTNEYYSTAFHEMVHSTGHMKRLKRFDNTPLSFANKELSYSKEELIAELGSSYLMNFLQIETTRSFQNSAAYIQGWLQAFNNDNRLIVSAASKAEQAINYILQNQRKEPLR